MARRAGGQLPLAYAWPLRRREERQVRQVSLGRENSKYPFNIFVNWQLSIVLVNRSIQSVSPIEYQ